MDIPLEELINDYPEKILINTNFVNFFQEPTFVKPTVKHS